MGDIKFVQGIFVDTVETQYGEIIKLSFDVDGFMDFVNNGGFVKTSEANGKQYFNAELKKSKLGKYYMAVDMWEPKPQDDGNPF